MRRVSIRFDRPHFDSIGRFQPLNTQVSWVIPNEWTDGWVSVQVALLGFSAALTYWRTA